VRLRRQSPQTETQRVDLLRGAPDHRAMLAIAAALALVAAQGQALELAYSDEAGIASAEAQWEGHRFRLVKHDARWIAVVGVDLDAKAGAHSAEVTFRYGDGRSRSVLEPVTVKAQKFPTTELKVEDRYVELGPEDAARAAREAQETDAIYATLTSECYWSASFVAPIHGAKDGRNFGHRRVFNGQPRAPHSGADLRADVGTPVYASNRGRVVLAKDLFYSGNAVIVDHGVGVYTMYLHLSKIDVAPGAMVERGQLLGLAGATGRVTGPHLHWGVRIVDARVDPFSLLRLGAQPPPAGADGKD
jgi:murein DD-endopeptidase MepM/ murein hydrolase activator NlpD